MIKATKSNIHNNTTRTSYRPTGGRHSFLHAMDCSPEPGFLLAACFLTDAVKTSSSRRAFPLLHTPSIYSSSIQFSSLNRLITGELGRFPLVSLYKRFGSLVGGEKTKHAKVFKGEYTKILLLLFLLNNISPLPYMTQNATVDAGGATNI